VTRTVDAKATKIARARQQRGRDVLQAIFGWDEEEARRHAREKLIAFPAAERARRRRKTKAQRRARRRNRA
jgi:hypothetical protein